MMHRARRRKESVAAACPAEESTIIHLIPDHESAVCKSEAAEEYHGIIQTLAAIGIPKRKLLFLGKDPTGIRPESLSCIKIYGHSNPSLLGCGGPERKGMSAWQLARKIKNHVLKSIFKAELDLKALEFDLSFCNSASKIVTIFSPKGSPAIRETFTFASDFREALSLLGYVNFKVSGYPGFISTDVARREDFVCDVYEDRKAAKVAAKLCKIIYGISLEGRQTFSEGEVEMNPRGFNRKDVFRNKEKIKFLEELARSPRVHSRSSFVFACVSEELSLSLESVTCEGPAVDSFPPVIPPPEPSIPVSTCTPPGPEVTECSSASTPFTEFSASPP